MSDEVYTNFLGQEIRPGTRVVYPAGSNRSVQMAEATVLSFELSTRASVEARYGGRRRRYVGRDSEDQPVYETVPIQESEWLHRVGRPVKMRIQPTGRTSRWQQHWRTREERENATPIKPVTLTANAESVVAIDESDAELNAKALRNLDRAVSTLKMFPTDFRDLVPDWED